jgi:hypothetical protein
MALPLGVLYGQRVYPERLLENRFLVRLLCVDEVGPDDGIRLLLPAPQKLLAAGVYKRVRIMSPGSSLRAP